MRRCYIHDDIDFFISSTLFATVHWAARLAVLSSFYGDEWLSCIPLYINKLIGVWRRRLVEYRLAGWRSIETLRDYQFVRNCHPFGVVCNIQTRSCNEAKLCPFCYARYYAYRAYEFLEKALYGSRDYLDASGHLKKADASVKMVEFSQRNHVLPRAGVLWTNDFIEKAASTVCRTLNTVRRREADILPGSPGFVFFRVAPGHEKLITQRSGLFLTTGRIPTNFAPECGKMSKFSMRVHPESAERITKGIIARAIGRVMRFPIRNFTAPADQVVAMICGMHRFRAFSTYRPDVCFWPES